MKTAHDAPGSTIGAPPAVRRAKGGRFLPGASANPGGRKRTPAEIQAALEAATPAAVARLVALIDDADPRVALKASEVILSRTLAPAPKAVEAAVVDVAEGVAAVEARLLALAMSGDRAAAVAYLAANAPDRYGRQAHVVEDMPDPITVIRRVIVDAA